MARRFHVAQVRIGENILERAATRHAIRVLRLKSGDAVELFDDAGQVGTGTIEHAAGNEVAVIVYSITTAKAGAAVHIASAVPKGSRAEWMIEKLCELGVTRFTPLATERAVVLPEGVGKLGRWQRIAEEAARQSGRAGVMQIDPLTPLEQVIGESLGFFGSTHPPAEPLIAALPSPAAAVTVLIGPEGGWTDGEIDRMLAAHWKAVTLGPTILRIETAAIAAAVISMQASIKA